MTLSHWGAGTVTALAVVCGTMCGLGLMAIGYGVVRRSVREHQPGSVVGWSGDCPRTGPPGGS